MKKTLVAVICAAFLSTGAFAKPVSHAPQSHHNSHTVQMTTHHASKPGQHHAPKPQHHAHQSKPTPVVVAHHHHNDSGAILLGDMILAFAILASNAM